MRFFSRTIQALFVLALLPPPPLTAQTHGLVLGWDGPLEGARVEVVNSGEVIEGISTDSQGSFAFGLLPPSGSSLRVSCIGYEMLAVPAPSPRERAVLTLLPAAIKSSAFRTTSTLAEIAGVQVTKGAEGPGLQDGASVQRGEDLVVTISTTGPCIPEGGIRTTRTAHTLEIQLKTGEPEECRIETASDIVSIRASFFRPGPATIVVVGQSGVVSKLLLVQ